MEEGREEVGGMRRKKKKMKKNEGEKRQRGKMEGHPWGVMKREKGRKGWRNKEDKVDVGDGER